MTPLMNVAKLEEKKENDFCQSLTHYGSKVCGLAIISGAEWCILHTPYARDGNRQEEICKTGNRFAKTMQQGILQSQQATLSLVYLNFYRLRLRNSQQRKRARHNLGYTKSRRYSQRVVRSLH